MGKAQYQTIPCTVASWTIIACIVSDYSKLHTKGLICCVHTKFLYEKTTLSLTQEIKAVWMDS